MKIRIKRVGRPDLTFAQFVEAHGLELIVHERPKQRGLPRYYADFANCEVRGNKVLIGEFGNGDTPEAAIQDYVHKIAGEILVVNAGGDRREIQCPNEWRAEKEKMEYMEVGE